MQPSKHRTAGRLALALGLAAVAGAVFSASTPATATMSAVAGKVEAVSSDRLPFVEVQAAPTERSVSYSSEQADRGKVRYDKDCEDCHGKNLKGGLNGGAPLRGSSFERKYADLPATALFGFMISAMPPNAPGRYSETTYAELMAYILKRNGFQPGAPLPTDFDALDTLIIRK